MLAWAGKLVAPVGAAVSTTQVRVVGSLSMPVELTALTTKVCGPCARFL